MTVKKRRYFFLDWSYYFYGLLAAILRFIIFMRSPGVPADCSTILVPAEYLYDCSY